MLIVAYFTNKRKEAFDEMYYEEDKEIYKTLELMKRISSLLLEEQQRLGLTQMQMAQKLDMPLQTYKCLSNPKNQSIVSTENLAKIFENSDITYGDVFNGIYKNK